jgi:hypothetical protein
MLQDVSKCHQVESLSVRQHLFNRTLPNGRFETASRQLRRSRTDLHAGNLPATLCKEFEEFTRIASDVENTPTTASRLAQHLDILGESLSLFRVDASLQVFDALGVVGLRQTL